MIRIENITSSNRLNLYSNRVKLRLIKYLLNKLFKCIDNDLIFTIPLKVILWTTNLMI